MFYIWDDPLLFRRGVDQIIRRCVSKVEQGETLCKCHASPYGGHFAGDEYKTHLFLSPFFMYI